MKFAIINLTVTSTLIAALKIIPIISCLALFFFYFQGSHFIEGHFEVCSASLSLVSWSGVRLSPLGTSVTDWPIVPTSDDDECGAVGGIKIGRGNRSTWRKAVPVTLSTTNPT
jgi:hypothetical protein